MIRLIIFRFWPALLPLVIYLVWFFLAVRRAEKQGKPAPHFRNGQLYWAVLASLILAAGCFILMGAEMEPQKGDYKPPVMRDGVVVPGRVEP